MNKKSYNIYQDLIQNSYNDPFNSIQDDDIESFITSKEINAISKKKINSDRSVSFDDHEIEEELSQFKRYTVKREHKYTAQELEIIHESCKRTIVHDYGDHDIYHISDEDRYSNDILNQIAPKLNMLKRTYRRVDQYIEAMRIIYQAWDILERNNFLHTREEFFEMVSKGEIVSDRILMPKLKGISSYNMDMISMYISNPDMDISHLVPVVKQSEDYFDEYDDTLDDEEEHNKLMRQYLSLEDIAYIESVELQKDDLPKMEIPVIDRKYIKGYDRRSFKRKRGENKQEIKLRKYIHESLNSIQKQNKDNSYGSSFMITHSMFEPSEKEHNPWDNIYFTGSWKSDTDVQLDDIRINEELLKEHPYSEAYRTYADEELKDFFDTLENNGINTLDLRRKIDGNTNSAKKVEEIRKKKENKKIEAALIDRITKLNNNPKFKKIVTKAENGLLKEKDD